MKTFSYKGVSSAGRAAKGLVDALDLKDARGRLSAQGVLVEKIQAVSGGHSAPLRPERLFDGEKRAMAWRELSSLLKAGLPLASALEVLIDSPGTGREAVLLAAARDHIREGLGPAEALRRANVPLADFEFAALEVGEKTGALDQMFEKLAQFLEEQARLREQVQTAMIYPAFILVLALIMTTVILGFMVPKLAGMLRDIRMELPLITQFMLGAGRWLSWLFIPLLLAGGLGGWAFARRMRARADFRVAVDRRLLGTPLIGTAYTALANLRFARTLALLLKSGVPLTEAVPMAGRATGSAWISELTGSVAEEVRHGASLAVALRAVPPLAASLPGWIRAGEASGDLEGLLESAAGRYQQSWNRLLGRLLALIEPILIVFVGGFVLLLALAILLPLLSLNQAMQ